MNLQGDQARVGVDEGQFRNILPRRFARREQFGDRRDLIRLRRIHERFRSRRPDGE